MSYTQAVNDLAAARAAALIDALDYLQALADLQDLVGGWDA